jgi:hypothetical protein
LLQSRTAFTDWYTVRPIEIKRKEVADLIKKLIKLHNPEKLPFLPNLNFGSIVENDQFDRFDDYVLEIQNGIN